MKSFLYSVLAAVLGAFSVLLILYAVNPGVFTPPQHGNPIIKKTVYTPLPSAPSAVPDAVDKIFPSVVYIDTKVLTEVSRPVYDIFGAPYYKTQIVPKSGSGTGVVIDSSGLILTNEHVIHGANEIMVTFSDDKTYPAVVKGSDLVSDIALIQVQGVTVIPAKLGDSDKVRIGESVIAVGSPYHFSKTVTCGVLSGRGRELSDQSKDFQDLLQTDAAINPGNSGGPLVNMDGEVIGINTAIIPFAQGIGFAIPINTIKNIVAQLHSSGKVVRPYIGIAMTNLNKQIAEYLHSSVEEGIVVTAVAPDGPAAFSGLVPKDIIISVNDKKVSSADQLRSAVKKSKPGDSMKLRILRSGNEGDILIKIGEKD